LNDEQIRQAAAARRTPKRFDVSYGPEFVNESEETAQTETVIAGGFRLEGGFVIFHDDPNPEWGPYVDKLALRADHIVRIEQKEIT